MAALGSCLLWIYKARAWDFRVRSGFRGKVGTIAFKCNQLRISYTAAASACEQQVLPRGFDFRGLGFKVQGLEGKRRVDLRSSLHKRLHPPQTLYSTPSFLTSRLNVFFPVPTNHQFVSPHSVLGKRA